MKPLNFTRQSFASFLHVPRMLYNTATTAYPHVSTSARFLLYALSWTKCWSLQTTSCLLLPGPWIEIARFSVDFFLSPLHCSWPKMGMPVKCRLHISKSLICLLHVCVPTLEEGLACSEHPVNICWIKMWTRTSTLTARTTEVPVTEVMFLEGLASQREDIQKGPECSAGITKVENNVL